MKAFFIFRLVEIMIILAYLLLWMWHIARSIAGKFRSALERASQ